MELKQKGANAVIGAFKQLKVSLIWTSAVDLDLMAFYKTKDGRTGGVYSENYAGGSHGNLNAFPFVQLSGDEGVGATGGDNREDLLIAKLDDFEELYICALNFTSASANQNTPFSGYDARVDVTTDKGESHTVRLDSSNPGSVAVIAKFTSGFLGQDLVNDSKVMDFDAFKAELPGAGELVLSSKITLKQKNDSLVLKPKTQSGAVVINLNWNTGKAEEQKKGFFKKMFTAPASEVDLDLGCFFVLNGPDGEMKSSIQPLNSGFLKQGSFDQPPYIYHEGDDRTGAAAAGENLRINLAHRQKLERVLIYTYIYEGVPNWSKTDGVVTVQVPGQPTVEVRMGEQTDTKRLCAICMLEFQPDGGIKVTKCVTFHADQEQADNAYGWGMRWSVGSKD
ncbi:MAG: tellurite resistance protein TerA [Myxococcota bacterium]|jgi:tellurite resistance protein TerA